MAYTIPVLALIVDGAAAAGLIGEAPDFFDNARNDWWDGVDRLCAVTGVPFETFTLEDDECMTIGLSIHSDFVFTLTSALLAQEAVLKSKFAHPLVQAATIGIASQFN